MKTLNILHISDAHIQKKDENEISELVQKLIKDIQRVQKQQDINIDLICFTGDLIQSGKNATCNECQWEMANSAMIEPLLSGLNLTRENFIIVPGNHEVDTSKIVGATEKGLLVDSLEEINANIKEMHESYLERLSYFYDGIRNMYNDVITEKIGYAFNRIINGINVGIVCLDTAWRSSGRGEVEKGIMYVGEQQIRDLYKHIKSSEIKICLMHHPTDWLSGYESSLIEKQLNKFDVVLCGHVHENDSKVIMRKEMNTIYNIAGKIYPLDFAFGRRTDGYNGYAILNLNLDISLCTIFMRTYYAKDREDFDAAINFCKEGKIEYPLNEDIEEKKMEYGIINGLKKFYLSMSEKLSLINRIDSEAPEDISTVYVEPILADRSEYDSEGSKNKHTVELQEIVNGNENIVCIGKKESGKTTILQNVGIVHVEEYTTRKIIPVYIDMRNLPKKGNIFQNAVTHFIEDNAEKDTKISRKKIEEIIDNGKCIFLIDNVDIYNSQHTELIKNFIKSNEGNKYIIAVQEQFFQALDIKKIPDYGCEFKKVFIHSFRKNQIRELVTKWANGKVEATDVGQVVDKIDGYCNQINFAKTPFNISIFMVLWDFNRNFVPQNEAYVMDNYLEIVLEKLSSKEGDRNSYGYRIKQDFMSSIAYAMFCKNEYYFTKKEFDEFVIGYHQKLGYKIEDTEFDTLFFEKNILCVSGDLVFFSHTSILEYYLALYAKNNRSFLDYMLRKGNRTNFKNEICFYSGLTPNCKDLLDGMAETIMEEICENINIIDELNEIEIMTDFKLDKEEIRQKIYDNRLSQTELDSLHDNYSVKEVEPLKLDKKNMQQKEAWNDEKDYQEGSAEDFISLLLMYGSVLKNAELLDNKDKVYHLENYMYAMNILLGKLLQYAFDKKSEFGINEVKEVIGNDEALSNINELDQKQWNDVWKIAFPIAVQKLISENVGTPKLELAIDELMKRKNEKPFEKFMFTFLKCDLGIGDIVSIIRKYIGDEKSSSILKMIFIKLVFYIAIRFFGGDYHKENEIVDLIIETDLKINPEEKVRKAYNANRELARKKVLGEIQKTGLLQKK